MADRIKIARLHDGMSGGGGGDDINLSIQFILNCGAKKAGSCHGGYHTSTYDFIKNGPFGHVPYDSCMSYLACSVDSTDGFCQHVDTTCAANNICRTCDTFAGMGGACVEIDYYPNATIAEFGLIDYDATDNDDIVQKIKSEIYMRGPVAATINAEPIVTYQGGVFTDDSHSQRTNHIVAIVGWGTEEETGILYWIVRK